MHSEYGAEFFGSFLGTAMRVSSRYTVLHRIQSLIY